jgi:hypothetical protein
MAAIEDDISMIGYEESDFEVESDDDDDSFMMVDEENKKSMALKSTKGKKAASSTNKSKSNKKNPILSPRTEGAGNVPKSSATTTAKGTTKNAKKKTVEETYQKKSQLEHILLRPDTYVGSVEPITEQMFIYDEVEDAIINKTITYTPGLYKIFDESKF